MLSIKNLLVLAVGVSAAVLPRSVPTIESDLRSINNQTIRLTKDIIAGPFNAIAISVNVDHLHGSLGTAISNVEVTSEVTDAEAQEIFGYTNDVLFPSIQAVLSALNERKVLYLATLLGPIVLNDLRTLRYDTNQYFNALSQLSLTSADDFLRVGAAIDQTFQRTIYNFSN
jgi:hypothetical protein